jgi:hypothetical protein
MGGYTKTHSGLDANLEGCHYIVWWAQPQWEHIHSNAFAQFTRQYLFVHIITHFLLLLILVLQSALLFWHGWREKREGHRLCPVTISFQWAANSLYTGIYTNSSRLFTKFWVKMKLKIFLFLSYSLCTELVFIFVLEKRKWLKWGNFHSSACCGKTFFNNALRICAEVDGQAGRASSRQEWGWGGERFENCSRRHTELQATAAGGKDSGLLRPEPDSAFRP